jgi:hypothetical protein
MFQCEPSPVADKRQLMRTGACLLSCCSCDSGGRLSKPMNAKRRNRLIQWWVAGSIALVALSYGVYVAVTWIRYGHAAPAARAGESDPLLDRFMPDYEVVDRHQVRVAAPVEITFATASEMDLNESVIVRGIFKSRQLILRGTQPEPWQGPRSFVAQAKAWGWGVLADVPDRETIMGAVTQPWVANVVFRTLPPDDFAAFHEPGYVKIVWTMRADPISPTESVFRTETRVATNDPVAHCKFRRYWSVFSPGIVLIRHVSLRLVKEGAERRVRETVRPQVYSSRTTPR